MTDIVEVVVKIPKDYFEYIKTLDKIGVGECFIDTVLDAFKDGTVLPEGHGRLIDESAILDAIDVAIHFANKEGHEYANAFENNGRWCAEYNSIENMIASAPTIIKADREAQ